MVMKRKEALQNVKAEGHKLLSAFFTIKIHTRKESLADVDAKMERLQKEAEPRINKE